MLRKSLKDVNMDLNKDVAKAGDRASNTFLTLH